MRKNTPMNDSQMKTFISQFCWIYAKTYAEVCPHEYIVKTKLDKMHWDSFEDAVKYIRDNGFDATYNKRVGKYYILDDYYYWTMGEPIDETIILNRARLSDYLQVDNHWIYKRE